MKLSLAIRLGAMLKPQGRGRLISDGRTCALGAAVDAIGGLNRHDEDRYQLAFDEWPILLRKVSHPLCAPDHLADIITMLNDSPIRWTREQIADFVESIECADEQQQLVELVSVEA